MITNAPLCIAIFGLGSAPPNLYSSCQYSDASAYSSTYNLGLQGPLANLTWINASYGINSSATFCECASGYGDPSNAGACYPLYGSNNLSTVDPLNASPAAILQTSSVKLLANILSFTITSALTLARNVTWFLSATGPSLTSPLNAGGSWQLAGSNNLKCRRPGLYDVSLPTPSISQDSVIAALDWNAITSNRTNSVSQCGFTLTQSTNQYINTAILTVVTTDQVPNSGLTRQSSQTYPISVTAPKSVFVASSAILVNSTINLQGYTVNGYFQPTTNQFSLVLQTSVSAPYNLTAVSATPPSGLFTSQSFVYNNIGQCQSGATQCTQQFIFNGTANVANLCPASSPQFGSLKGSYQFVLQPQSQSGSASIPSTNININVQTDTLCTSVAVGANTQTSLIPYLDTAFSVPMPVTGVIPGQRVNWNILVSSSQVSVLSVRINAIWFGPTTVINMAVSNPNVTYGSGTSNVAYPSSSSTYPQVRMLWDYLDAYNCNIGTANYPLTPNAPAAPGTTQATCNPMTGGTGVVQSPWLITPSATPEYLYSNGSTQLGVANNLAVIHQVTSSGSFVNGISSASASFSHDTSILFTGPINVNNPNSTSTGNIDYSRCNASMGLQDPCQKYLYLLAANTLGQYAFATSLTITYAGSSSISAVKKRHIILKSDSSLIRRQQDHLFDFKVKDYYNSQQDQAALTASEIAVNANNNTDSDQNNSSVTNFTSSYGFAAAMITLSCIIAVSIGFSIVLCIKHQQDNHYYHLD